MSLLLLTLACTGPDRSLEAWGPDPAAFADDAAQLRAATARAARVWQPPKDKPDIVVIVLDTVRADRMGLYGYPLGTTPTLDRWAEQGRVYDQAIADAPWTLPSHASLFTGRGPTAHGAHGEHEGGRLRFATPLAQGTPTVARSLRDAGYLTVGIAANQAYLHPRWGLSQGFGVWLCDRLVDDARRAQYPAADRITSLALHYLERPREGPTFLFLNYLDAHAPWIPREGYVRDPAAIDRNVLPYGTRGWRAASTDVLTGKGVSPEVIASWSEAYDSELRYLDEQVGRLLDGLADRGIDENDWVFVLSDHGEYLGEHALVQHSRDVYEPALRVPLVVRGPGVAAGRDPAPIQHHDVATLILAAAGLPPLPSSTPTAGVAVSEQHYAREADVMNPAYGHRFRRIRRAFRVGDLKLILGTDDTEELYDLAADPGELHPLDDSQALARMRRAAREWERITTPAPVADDTRVDAQTRARLKALGYEE